MKTILLRTQNLRRTMLVGSLVLSIFFTYAQSGPGGGSNNGSNSGSNSGNNNGNSGTSVPELVFKNPTLLSGTAGADGAVYKFEDVTTNVNALVTIAGRSSSLVRISSIDINNTGYNNAFQPQISYNNGNASSNKNWWADFDIRFVNKSAGNAVAVESFNVTALDVDGDGSKLSEYVSFYNATSYVLESNSQLRVISLLQTILGILIPGRQFDGPTTNYTDIDVTATRVMTTLKYNNTSTFRLRAGAQTSNGSSSVADRMYSFWFKGFNFNTPVQSTLPVKLISFSALLDNDKVELRWASAEEKNVSHFEVEKSTDGKNYNKIGVVFAYGNSSEIRNYSFTDKDINPSRAATYYYRLRSVDIDTKSEFSQVRVIKVSQQGGQLSIQTYPNPASVDLRVTIPTTWQGKKVSYELINNSGQIAMRSEAAHSSQTETLNVSKLAPGYYVVRASCNGEVSQQKIIKQ